MTTVKSTPVHSLQHLHSRSLCQWDCKRGSSGIASTVARVRHIMNIAPGRQSPHDPSVDDASHNSDDQCMRSEDKDSNKRAESPQSSSSAANNTEQRCMLRNEMIEPFSNKQLAIASTVQHPTANTDANIDVISPPAKKSPRYEGSFTQTKLQESSNFQHSPGHRKQSQYPTSSALSVESMTAREMHALTSKERQSVYEEVHGVQQLVKEDMRIVQEALDRMETEINLIQSKPGYEQALFLNQHYVQDPSFRLRFLRSARMDEAVAAKCFVNHFDYKRKLFGDEHLVKDVTFEDLNADAQAPLKSGSIQILPTRDQSGRPIVCFCPRRQQYRNAIDLVRACHFVLTAVTEDPELQKRGIVLIIRAHGHVTNSNHRPMFDPEVHEWVKHMAKALPVRICATHYCFDDEKLKQPMAMVQLALGRHGRIRFRAHRGSAEETRSSLVTYGIDPALIPTDAGDGDIDDDDDGGVNAARNIEPIESRKHQRRLLGTDMARVSSPVDTNSQVIVCLNPNDVLFGKSKPCLEFAGNLAMVKLVQKNFDAHQGFKDRAKKAQITRQIVAEIKAAGGRFLRRTEHDTNGWLQVSDEDARSKVSHTFRNIKQSRLRVGAKRKSDLADQP